MLKLIPVVLCINASLPMQSPYLGTWQNTTCIVKTKLKTLKKKQKKTNETKTKIKMNKNKKLHDALQLMKPLLTVTTVSNVNRKR